MTSSKIFSELFDQGTDKEQIICFKDEQRTIKHRDDGQPAVECKDGRKEWWIDGKLHREGGPAIEYPNGDQEWYKDGRRHREDGYATITQSGCSYFLNGIPMSHDFYKESIKEIKNKSMNESTVKSDFFTKTYRQGTPEEHTIYYKDKECKIKHREDGPAIERVCGTKEWYKNDIRHRDDGPAVIDSTGYKGWWVNGKRHREDGPAMHYGNGAKYYYLEGIEYEKKAYDAAVVKLKEKKNSEDLSNNLYKKTVGVYVGSQYERTIYYKDKECTIVHRENGPAIEYKNGRKEWWVNHKCHREGGPAIELANGHKEWWIDGKLHREDGPAKEFSNGDKEWYKHDKLHREDGPASEFSNGDKIWYTKGLINREDGPAIEWANGDKSFYLNSLQYDEKNYNAIIANRLKYAKKSTSDSIAAKDNEELSNKLHKQIIDKGNQYTERTLYYKEKNSLILHREDGPAIEWKNGGKDYYLDGYKFTEEQFNIFMIHKKNDEFNKTNPVKEIALTYSVVFDKGTNIESTRFFKDEQCNLLHREDGPAIQFKSGAKHYYLNGMEFNQDQYYTIAAIIAESAPRREKGGYTKVIVKSNGEDSSFRFYKDKECKILHREDGPAAELSNGTKHWYINGECHREGGPAIEYSDGSKEWYKNGKIHREDGPAVENVNGNNVYYWNNVEVSKDQWEALVSDNKNNEVNNKVEDKLSIYTKVLDEGTPHECMTYYKDKELSIIHREDGPAKIWKNGNKAWWVNGNLHREDGPAVECANGDKIWWINGFIHREDGPAIERANGRKEWHMNNIFHRIGGPAIEESNGDKFWYIAGKQYSEEEYMKVCNFMTNIKEPLAKTTNDTPSNVVSNARTTKGETKMTQSIFEMLTADAEEAAYKVAANQLTDVVQQGILTVLSGMDSEGINADDIASFKKILNTKYFSAAISSSIGIALTQIPHLNEDERVLHLAKHFRVEGMALLGNEVINVIKAQAVPIVTAVLADLPPITGSKSERHRIPEGKKTATETTETVDFSQPDRIAEPATTQTAAKR